MATPYTDVSTFPNQVTRPDDGDVIDAASVNVPLEGLANRTRFLYDLSGGVSSPYLYTHAALDTVARPTGNDLNFAFNARITTNELVVASLIQVGNLTPVRRAIAVGFARPLLGTPEVGTVIATPGAFNDQKAWWYVNENETSPIGTDNPAMNGAIKQRYSPLSPSSYTTPYATWRGRFATGGIITSVSIRIVPANHPVLPDNRPSLQAKLVDVATGTDTNMGRVVDPSANAAAYSLPHTITLTTGAFTISGTQVLLVSLRGEEGNNANASATYATSGGLVAFPPVVNYTRQTIGED